MLIVGELFNTSRKIIKENVEMRNAEYIRNLAQKQVSAGADYLDVNCSDISGSELDVMKWLVENIQAAVSVSLCIDSPNPATVEIGLSMVRNGQPMVNSITAEEERYTKMLPLVIKSRAKVVALAMDDGGVPEAAKDSLRVAKDLIYKLTQSGIAKEDIYLDPLIKPIGVDDRAVLDVIDTVRSIKQEFPGVHIISALSNVSFGLPNRKVLNNAFMIQCLTVGVDAFILDPLDRVLIGNLRASQALLGQDPYCAKYLAAHRSGLYKN